VLDKNKRGFREEVGPKASKVLGGRNLAGGRRSKTRYKTLRKEV
jgi:hypothetical protein